MGLIRKAISGTAAIATGGASLGVVQWRSDTERVAHQTKLLRKEIERQHEESLALQKDHVQVHESQRDRTGQVPSPGSVMTNTTALESTASGPVSMSHRLDDIARLSRLRNAGVLSEEEFQAEKRSILSALE